MWSGRLLRFRKLRKIQVETLWPGQIGVAMELELTLAPLEVSFGGIEFREVGGPPAHETGYFMGRAAQHSPTNWASVGNRNVLTLTDTAGWNIIPAQLASPLGQGDYQWQIPGEVKIGTTVVRLANSVLSGGPDRADPCGPAVPRQGHGPQRRPEARTASTPDRQAGPAGICHLC